MGLHQPAARHDDAGHVVGYPLAVEDRRSCSEVFDPPVRARPDEHAIDLDVPNGRSRLEVHVFEGSDRRVGFDRVSEIVGMGDHTRDRERLARIRAPRDEGLQGRCIQDDLLIEDRTVVDPQASPLGDGGVPLITRRCHRTPLDVGERRVVRGDHAGPCTRFDGHVANRHPAFHREPLDGRAPVLDHVAGGARRPDLCDDGEDDVLCRDAWRQVTLDGDGHRLRRPLGEGLGGQDVLDLRRPDAECEGAERTVRGCVGVPADDGHAGLGDALLGSDHVNDSLPLVIDAEQRDVVLDGVSLERRDLGGRHGVCNALSAVGGRDGVVDRGQGQLGTTHGPAGHGERLECLR